MINIYNPVSMRIDVKITKPVDVHCLADFYKNKLENTSNIQLNTI
jgi:hypothetical protein